MDLQDEFKNSRLLDCSEQIELNEALSEPNPRFMQKFSRGWHQRFLRRVFNIADSSLDAGKAEAGLSEFTTTYNKLDSKISGTEESKER